MLQEQFINTKEVAEEEEEKLELLDSTERELVTASPCDSGYITESSDTDDWCEHIKLCIGREFYFIYLFTFNLALFWIKW